MRLWNCRDKTMSGGIYLYSCQWGTGMVKTKTISKVWRIKKLVLFYFMFRIVNLATPSWVCGGRGADTEAVLPPVYQGISFRCKPRLTTLIWAKRRRPRAFKPAITKYPFFSTSTFPHRVMRENGYLVIRGLTLLIVFLKRYLLKLVWRQKLENGTQLWFKNQSIMKNYVPIFEQGGPLSMRLWNWRTTGGGRDGSSATWRLSSSPSSPWSLSSWSSPWWSPTRDSRRSKSFDQEAACQEDVTC